jgi:hypothetical protein
LNHVLTKQYFQTERLFFNNSVRGKRVLDPTKNGVLREKIISSSIFEAMGLGLKETLLVLAIESYNIAVFALYIRLNISVQTDF